MVAQRLQVPLHVAAWRCDLVALHDQVLGEVARGVELQLRRHLGAGMRHLHMLGVTCSATVNKEDREQAQEALTARADGNPAPKFGEN